MPQSSFLANQLNSAVVAQTHRKDGCLIPSCPILFSRHAMNSGLASWAVKPKLPRLHASFVEPESSKGMNSCPCRLRPICC